MFHVGASSFCCSSSPNRTSYRIRCAGLRFGFGCRPESRASILLRYSTSEQSPLCSDAFFMPTRAHAQKASSASPSPPSKTVPFCAGPGLKARCCPARCPQSPSTPSKLQSPSTPSKKKRARPKAYPFLFGTSAGKKAAFGPLIQMLWGLKCSGGRLSPCVFF